MDEQDVKTRILKGAEELFLRYGMRSITMDEVARHLGMSKKTLYQYFMDKDDIVTSVTSNHLQRQQQRCEQIQVDTSNAVEQMVKLSLYFKESMRGLNPAIMFDLQKYHIKAWQLWSAYKLNVIGGTMAKNMHLGIAQGLYRDDINPEVLAISRIQTVQIAFDDQLFPRDRYTMQEVQLHLLDHFVYGLLSDKGRKQYRKFREKYKEPQSLYHE